MNTYLANCDRDVPQKLQKVQTECPLLLFELNQKRNMSTNVGKTNNGEFHSVRSAVLQFLRVDRQT